jgi:hypothetical protein
MVELSSAAILILYVAIGARSGAFGWARRILEAAVLAAGATLGEEICMRVYGAYRYDLDWLPLSVAVTWPVVILSGRAVARLIVQASGAAERWLPVWTGIVVWFDASLVEPIATHAGLWHWSLNGPFGAPLIGPLGWGFYAAAGTLCLQRLRGAWVLLGALIAPVLAQALILATWWGGLRELSGAWPEGAALAAGLLLCAAATVLALRVRRSARLPWREAVPRASAAALFFALLGVRPDGLLALFAVAFSPPYLALLPAIQGVGEGKPRQKARK